MPTSAVFQYRKVLQLDLVSNAIFQIQTEIPETAIYNRGVDYWKSFHERGWLLRAAEMGNFHAMEVVGVHLLAENEDQSRQLGLNWLRRAAESGAASAQTILGEHLLDGERVASHHTEGEPWLWKAAHAGYHRAIISLAVRMMDGDGVERNQEQGLEMLRGTAMAGSVVSCALLAAHYIDCSSVTEGLSYLENSGAVQPGQMVKVAIFLYLDSLSASTMAQRKRFAGYAGGLLRFLASRGAAGAGANLAYLLRRGELSADRFPALAEILDPLIATGDSFALMNQVLRLAAGVDCTSDWTAANTCVCRIIDIPPVLNWWRARAQSGDAEGHLVIAWLLRNKMQTDPDGIGLRVRIDLAKQAGWNIPEWFSGRQTNLNSSGKDLT